MFIFIHFQYIHEIVAKQCLPQEHILNITQKTLHIIVLSKCSASVLIAAKNCMLCTRVLNIRLKSLLPYAPRLILVVYKDMRTGKHDIL